MPLALNFANTYSLKVSSSNSHTLMEIPLNLMGFINFFYKEMLTSLILFSSRYAFSLNLLLKASFA